MSKKRLLIMAGGTGGHIYPGLAVANQLHCHDVDIAWLGSTHGLENTIITQSPYPLHRIQISGLRGKGRIGWLLAPWRLTHAVWQAMRILRRYKPDAVLGMGGFASGPGGIAAWLLRVPLVIHEQNAVAGLTNRCLSHVSKKVLTGFPRAIAHRRAHFVGNPVRRELIDLGARAQPTPTHPRLNILVIGGSRGASALNSTIPRALACLSESQRPNIVHQSGEQGFEATQALYQSLSINATVKPYINDMAQAYANADLLICRAGAMTVAELSVMGRPAIFVPYPHAVDDHQTKNARFLVDANASLMLNQSDLTPETLAELLKTLINSPSTLNTLANNLSRLSNATATDAVANACMEVMS